MSLEIIPDILGKRYELYEILGQGGMGSVYHAVDRLTGRDVALKRVLSDEGNLEFSSTNDAIDFRFSLAQEFKLLASVHHPHIIEVLDYGFDLQQHPYFTMELLSNAKTILEAGEDLAVEKQLDLIVQALQALAYLHRRGILHRDLKPMNILVVDGSVRVLDFGLSVMKDRSHERHITGSKAGTLSYMAPEILLAKPPTEQVDLYAIGMIAYELIAGYHPFQDTEVNELVNHIMYTLPDTAPLEKVYDVASIIQRLLQKDPADRYQQAKDVIIALQDHTSYNIRSESIATRDSYLKSARLIGRQTELGQLTTALRQIGKPDRKGMMWMVVGESGVGKSRLIDEVCTLAMVDGALVMRGYATNIGDSPYQIWHSVFRWVALLGALEPTDAGLLKLLFPDIVTLPEFSIEKASEIGSQKILDRLSHILQTTLKRLNQSVVIILEDLQWANHESIALLSRMYAFIGDIPVLLIGSYRDNAPPALSDQLLQVPVLKLNRLSDNDIRHLSEAILGEAGGQDEIVKLLKSATEGNIFFMIEVIRTLAEEIGALDDIGKITLPESVFTNGIQTIIRRRLENLPEWTYDLLEVAAIMGRHQDRTVLQYIAKDTDLDLWLIECANGAVLEIIDGEWQFMHDSLRDAILERLDDEKHKQTHKRIAKALEAIYDPQHRTATLAYHWRNAGDIAQEVFYVVLSGEKALRQGAYVDAINHFDRVIMLLETTTVEGIPPHVRPAYLKHRKADAYLGLGNYNQAKILYKESLHLSQELNDQQNIANAVMALGDIDYAQGKLTDAQLRYQQSLTIFHEINHQDSIARLLNSLGNVAYDRGDEDMARMFYQQSIDLSRELGSQWGMAGSIRSAMATSEEKPIGEIQKLLEEELQTQQKQNNLHGVAETYFTLGLMAFRKNIYDPAYNNLKQALALHEQNKDLEGVVKASNLLAEISYALSNYDESRQYVHQALKIALQTGNHFLIFESLLNFAMLLMSDSQTELAVMIVAFIANTQDAPDTLIDRADEMALSFEAILGSDKLAAYWEQGKSMTFDDIIGQALTHQ